MPRITTATILLALTACLVLPASPASAATSAVHITKIHYAQSGTNLNTEYITFKNTASTRRTITGWRITSSPSTDNQSYRFPTTTLSGGATLTLYSGHGTNRSGRRYWGSSTPIWNNSGDIAVLTNLAGSTVGRCRYPGGGTTFYC